MGEKWGGRAMRRFKLESASVPELNGFEFTVEDNATEEEIAKEAADCAIENLSFGWEEVKPSEAEKLKKPKPGKQG